MAAFSLVSATVYPALAQPSTEDTVRFLQQATFGPSSDLIAHVQSLGLDNQTAFSAYLAEQLGLPVPDYPDDSPYWPESPDSELQGRSHLCS